MTKAILSLCLEFVSRKGQSDWSYCLDIFFSCGGFYYVNSTFIDMDPLLFFLFFFSWDGVHTPSLTVTLFHHSWYLTLFSIVMDLWPCKAESIFVTYESQIFVYNLFHWTKKCIWSSCHLLRSCMRLWFNDFNLLLYPRFYAAEVVIALEYLHCLGISSKVNL